MHKMKFKRLIFGVLVVGLCAFALKVFLSGRQIRFRAEGVVWNTDYHVAYTAPRNLSDSVLPLLHTIGHSVSPFDPSSRISAVNANRTDTLDAYLLRLYRLSQQVYRLSNGAFDPTVAPLVNAWGFGYRHMTFPDSADIDSLLRFVGLDRTRLEGNRIIKSDPRTEFNFSATAKGMGCDEVAAMLRRNGARNLMVEIGGEIVTRGSAANGRKWRIAVDSPLSGHGAALCIEVNDAAIATSGNYRNFRTDSMGHRYAHTISPHTGYPVQTDVLSATVVADDCMTADAWATAFMALGAEQSQQIATEAPELAVLLILSDPDAPDGMRLWYNTTFTRLIPENLQK